MESCAGLAASPSEALQLHCRRPQSMSRQSALSLPWAVLPATTFRPATPVYDERARLVTVWRRPPHTPANVSIRSAALARPSLWIEEDQGPRGPPRFPASTRGARSHAVPDLRAVGDAPRRLVVLRLVQQQLLPRVHGGCNSVSGIPPTSPGPPSRASSEYASARSRSRCRCPTPHGVRARRRKSLRCQSMKLI